MPIAWKDQLASELGKKYGDKQGSLLASKYALGISRRIH